MPIYVYGCGTCDTEVDRLQPMGTDAADCRECGASMTKKPTAHALVFMNGAPSFRKQYLGTAPHTGRVTGLEGKGGPGSSSPEGIRQGKAWLESLA
jgi:putative FmdB family regulatory protein|tara:strand:- start:1710 stop:1997 length:288 start_codon:yes stop_codon:yes gene_type:complete